MGENGNDIWGKMGMTYGEMGMTEGSNEMSTLSLKLTITEDLILNIFTYK